MTSESGVKLHVDLPNHAAIGGETFWADHVGDSLYRLANVPFWAYGLNYRDIVRAIPDSDGILTIHEVTQPSGHRTLRVMFADTVDTQKQSDLLGEIHQPNTVTFERADDHLIAINIAPDADYLAVFDQLEAWGELDLLDFETCHPRVDGSFDDAP